jgi:hypothetical protein
VAGVGLGPQQHLRSASSLPIPFDAVSSGDNYTQLTPVTDRYDRGTVAHDWIPRDIRTMNKVVRLIYLTDAVAGPAIDFYREVPFGPVVLGGIKDEHRLKFYYDALDRLKIHRYLPYLAGDLLVIGRLITHLLLNESLGMWEDMIVHDSDYIFVEPSPILGEEPTIDLLVPPQYQRWATSPDPRVIRQRSRLDHNLVKLMAAGATIPLSPENTIYVPRKASANDDMGTSLLMRILPIIAIEWAYLQSEVTGLRRRAAPWTIIKAGIEDKWEPSPEEMQALQDMFVVAEEDPVGAKLVVRNGVEFDQVGGHTELAKWLEQWSTLKEAKLQGLGMNEAFATGEASWSYLESMLSLGMERIRNFRQFIAVEVLQEGILAPLARLNEHYRRSKAEIDHRIRTSAKTDENLDIPSVEWSRSLQPTADRDYLDILEMLEGKGLIVPLRKWAQAGGYDLEEALDGTESDLKLRKRLADYKKRVKAISGPDEEEDEGGGGRWSSVHQWVPAQIVECVAELPIWKQLPNNEFLTLRRGEVSRLTEYVPPLNGRTPGAREWHKVEASMLDDGIRMSKIQAFQYLLTRAGVLQDVDLPIQVVAKVRDDIIKRMNGKVPNREAMSEITWLNHELEKQNIDKPERVYQDATPIQHTAPWIRPAGPKLLSGEGYDDVEE